MTAKNPNLPTFEDSAEGALKCIEETSDDALVAYIKERLDNGEYRLSMDMEHKMVWAVRGDYMTLAIVWLDEADVEVSDTLMERVYGA